MLTELRSYIAKATTDDDEDQIFNLTNFDVQEVSNVDVPANEQKYLLIKGQLKMAKKKLLEILGNDAGEFLTKLDALAKDEGDDLGAGDDDGDAAPPALQLSEAVKAETMKHLGTVINALVAVAKAVNAAEVVTEGDGALPDEIKGVVRSSSLVLGKLVGEAVAPAPGVAPGEAGKGKLANAAGAVDKAKIDQFGKDLATIGDVVANLRTALGVEGAKPPGEAGGEAGGDAGKGAEDPNVAKALDGITQLLKRQGAAITDLRGRVGLPSALPAEGERVTKAAGDDFNGWPMDMNEDRRQAAR